MSQPNEPKLLERMFKAVELVRRSVKAFTHSLETGRLQHAQFLIVTMGYANTFYSFGERLQNVEKNGGDPNLRRAIDKCFDQTMKDQQHDWLTKLARGKMTHQGHYPGYAWVEFDVDDWATPQYRLGLIQTDGSVLTAESYFGLVLDAFAWWEAQLRGLRSSYLANGGDPARMFDPDEPSPLF